MITIAIIAILLFVMGILAFVVIKSVAQPKKLESIDKLIKQQKFAAAERIAKSIIAKDSRDFKAHYYLGKAYLADKKNELALMEYKLDELTKRVDKHNNTIERTYRLEEQMSLQEEKMKVANHRIDDLERKVE